MTDNVLPMPGKVVADELPFAGADYTPTADDLRLKGQLARIFDVMRDGQWRTLEELAEQAHAPAASASAQLRNLRKEPAGSHTIEKRSRGARNVGLYEYRLLVNTEGNRP